MKGQFGEIKRQMMRWMSGWKVHTVWILRLVDRDVLKQRSLGTGLESSSAFGNSAKDKDCFTVHSPHEVQGVEYFALEPSKS